MRDISFVVAPTVEHAFFKQSEFERLFRNNLLQITRHAAQVFDFISIGSTCRVPRQTPFSSLHEVLGPFVIDALRDAFTAAQLSDAVFAPQAVRLISLTIFSLGLLRVPVVCLIFHSSVVTMSQEHSLIK
jgi:hypothetical protein